MVYPAAQLPRRLVNRVAADVAGSNKKAASIRGGLLLMLDETKLSRPPDQDGHHQTRPAAGGFFFTSKSLTVPERGVKESVAHSPSGGANSALMG